MAINTSGKELQSSVSEMVGYKSGLALSTPEMISLLDEDSSQLLQHDGYMRIYPDEVEQLIADLLYKVGSIDSPSTVPVTIQMFHKYKSNKKLLKIYMNIGEMFNEFLNNALKSKNHGPRGIDPTSFLDNTLSTFGVEGYKIAIAYLEGLNHQLHISPWSNIEHYQYKSSIELRKLFESASLDVEAGSFIDQRYIDFLHRNFKSIDKIHWRKFEALTAEFFDRQNFTVELGPGSNDGGVDVRVWNPNKTDCAHPTLLIQCKRTKDTISRPIVKSLWADVVHEKAHSGLIVTTSRMSTGAKMDCKVRSYPIEECNREHIRKWIEQMRTPGKGVFMGE